MGVGLGSVGAISEIRVAVGNTGTMVDAKWEQSCQGTVFPWGYKLSFYAISVIGEFVQVPSSPWSA